MRNAKKCSTFGIMYVPKMWLHERDSRSSCGWNVAFMANDAFIVVQFKTVTLGPYVGPTVG